MPALEDMIEELYHMVEEARGVPFANERCIIDRDRLLEVLDDIKNALPSELAEANEIVRKRENMLSSVQRDAKAIREGAERDVRRMTSESEIVKAAQRRAKEIVSNAEAQVRELRRVANEYCSELLKQTEESIASSLEEIRKSRQRFRNVSRK